MQLFQKEKKLVTLEKYSRKKHKTHPSHEAVWIADVGFNAMTSPSEAYEPSSVHLWSSHTSTLSLRCPLGRRTFSFFFKKKDVQWTIRNRTPNNWANTLALVDVGELYVWVQSQRTSCCSPRSAVN